MNVVLIGLRGSGKTTVGRIVAQTLGHDFVDLDDLTPAALNEKSAADAWRKHGEQAFRAKEASALLRMLGERVRVVIAAGGGTPTAPGAPEMLRLERAARRTVVVYLSCRPETMRARLSQTDVTTRPSLTGADPLDEIEAVLGQRDALYRGLADHVVETDDMNAEQVARRISGLVGSR